MATTDDEDIAKIDRVTGDEAPITREYMMMPWAAGRPYAVALDTVEGFIRDTRPDLIGFDTLDRMRRHAPIKAGLILIKMPVLSRIRLAQAECDDPDIQAFVQHEVIDSGLLYKLAVSSMRAVDFGVAFHEKRWTAKELHIEYDSENADTGEKTTNDAWDGIAHTYKEIREVNPVTVTHILRRTTERGYKGAEADESFDGFTQGEDGTGQPREVDPWRAFVFTHSKEFGNMWGEPRDRDAYPYYIWAQFVLKCWMAWVERKVIPPNKSFFPMGKSKLPNGQEIDNQTIALMVGKAINNSSTIALPSTNISKDARGTSGRRIFRDWDIEEVSRTDVTTIFSETKAMLDTDMFRAMFTPPRTFDSGNSDGGLFSTDAEAHFDVFLATEDGLILDFGSHSEDYVVEPLVVVNFGKDAPKCRIKIPGLSDEQRQMLASTFTAILVNPDNQARIDFDKLAKGFSVPLKELEPEGENGNAGINTGEIAGLVPSGNEAPGNTQPGQTGINPNPSQVPAGQAGSGANANPSGSANPAPGQPHNLVLEDTLETYLALTELVETIELKETDFNAARWSVTPDSTSVLGYAVVDQSTGKRVGGYIAMQVIKSYEKQGEAASKKAASAAKSQQSKAAAAAKKATNEAAAAQRKADAAAAKAQREQTAAAKRAEAQAKREAAATQRKATQLEKQQERAAATAQKHEQTAQAHAAKIAQTAQAHAAASVIDPTITESRAQAKKETTTLAATTKAQDAKTATASMKAAGWTPTGSFNDRNAALQQATAEAASDPKNNYTVLPVAGGFVVASKAPTAAAAIDPKATAAAQTKADKAAAAKAKADAKAAKAAATPPKVRKVKAEDDSAPNDETTRMINKAARRLGRIFSRG